jgi:HPt (histidine-containing phosphotransfer) domain-containing protein
MPILRANYSDIDHDELAAAMGLKKHYIAMLLESFKEESLALLDAFHRAIEEMEYDGIRSSAHAIKGSSGNIKLNEVYEMAKEVEFAAANRRNDFEYKAYFQAIKSAIETIS